jgi:hypothetical protein
MDPTDPGDRPPEPERPLPPRPAWPPPPAATGPGQPPGSAPPAPPGWGPPPGSQPSAPSGWGQPAPPPTWGPPPPTWGYPIPPSWGPPPRRRGRTAWVLAGLAALLAVVLVAVLVARTGPAGPAGPPGAPPRAAGPARAAAPALPDPRTDLPKLLAKRAKAIVDDDRTAFLSTVDKRQKTWYRDQSTEFGRLRTVPFSAFTYRVVDLRSGNNLKRRYDADQVYLGQVEARYRFRNQDASPVLTRHSFTFALVPAGWRIAGPGDRRLRARDDVEIWDGGQVRTLRSARSLVVYHPGQDALARRLLTVADRAYGQVGAAWTGTWERKAVILVPRDQQEAERLVHARDLSRVAALASSSIESDQTGRVLGNRIVINTTNVVRYRPLDLQVLITHEMTHVATRTLGDGVPLLLVEGFADWAALLPVKLPFTITRAALVREVRSGGFDGVLPGDRDFRGPDAGVAYDEGSAFCLWVARTFGAAKLRALYREFAGTSPASAAALDHGFREVLGLSRRTAERRWAAWVRDQA